MTFTGKMVGDWWLHQLAIREGKTSDWKRPEGLPWTYPDELYYDAQAPHGTYPPKALRNPPEEEASK